MVSTNIPVGKKTNIGTQKEFVSNVTWLGEKNWYNWLIYNCDTLYEVSDADKITDWFVFMSDKTR